MPNVINSSSHSPLCIFIKYAHVFLDHIVIVGNHRDAWLYGGTDASSGTAVLMELARVFGSLVKKGEKVFYTNVCLS